MPCLLIALSIHGLACSQPGTNVPGNYNLRIDFAMLSLLVMYNQLLSPREVGRILLHHYLLSMFNRKVFAILSDRAVVNIISLKIIGNFID